MKNYLYLIFSGNKNSRWYNITLRKWKNAELAMVKNKQITKMNFAKGIILNNKTIYECAVYMYELYLTIFKYWFSLILC